MSAEQPQLDFKAVQKKVIEMAVQLGLLLLMFLWCLRIVEPFILVMMWGIIVAIALHPIFERLAALLSNRDKLAATLLVVALIGMLVAPAMMLTESLLDGAQALVAAGEAGDLHVPAPPESVAEWPIIGERVYATWQKAATNLPAVLADFAPQIKLMGAWLLDTVTGTGLGILQFIVAFIISGVLLANTDAGVRAAHGFATRIAPQRGPEFARLSSSTIRNVAIGIVGVSIFQASMLSVGFLVIGLPAAGLAALVALILCIVQIGPGLVSLVSIIYAFSALDTWAAGLFTVWTMAFTLCDSVLKPLVFGRGAAVPTLVIFLGAIGGMLAYGIIGLFVGAVVLSLGFKLYEVWLQEAPVDDFPPEEWNAQAGDDDIETLEADYKV